MNRLRKLSYIIIMFQLHTTFTNVKNDNMNAIVTLRCS